MWSRLQALWRRQLRTANPSMPKAAVAGSGTGRAGLAARAAISSLFKTPEYNWRSSVVVSAAEASFSY